MQATVCEKNRCSGCKACIDSCGREAITIIDELDVLNAYIDADRCVGCGRCHSVCPQNNPFDFKEPQAWHQAWAADEAVRRPSSSGGVAAALSRAFVQSGGVVCSCAFEAGEFKFAFAEQEDELAAFRGSKYVRSDAEGAYRQVRSLLRAGHEVLFIGLPCQVSALHHFVGERLGLKLYTVDLICHGTPSVKLLECYLRQHGYDLNGLESIDFRRKGSFQLRDGEHCFATPGVCDAYLMAFLNGLTYAEGCYRCNFARRERVSDMTLGDSWDTDLADEEVRRGVSLVLCQTEKGERLLGMSELHFEPVDVERAVASNGQLREPYPMPAARAAFFKGVKADKSFDAVVHRYLPKQAFKQDLKGLLIRLGLYKPRGGAGLLVYGIIVVDKTSPSGDAAQS